MNECQERPGVAITQTENHITRFSRLTTDDLALLDLIQFTIKAWHGKADEPDNKAEAEFHQEVLVRPLEERKEAMRRVTGEIADALRSALQRRRRVKG